jgi:hypothetical protein
VLARWERSVADPAVIYELVGAHLVAIHHLQVHDPVAA